MATRRFGLSVGKTEFSINEAAGAATVTDNIEITVDLANTIVTDNGVTRTVSREEVILALEQLMNYIVKVKWPPA